MNRQINDHPMLQVPRLNVTSSNIKSIGYEAESRTLLVEFHTNAVYSYSPITEEAFNEFCNADSKGKYFNEKIKSNTTITVANIRPKTEDVDGAPYNDVPNT